MKATSFKTIASFIMLRPFCAVFFWSLTTRLRLVVKKWACMNGSMVILKTETIFYRMSPLDLVIDRETAIVYKWNWRMSHISCQIDMDRVADRQVKYDIYITTLLQKINMSKWESFIVLGEWYTGLDWMKMTLICCKWAW